MTNMVVRKDEPAMSDCRAVADILARVGDKWTVMIVGALSDGPMRYNAIQRLIDGISQRMLTLRGLEQDGLVTRTVFPVIPPRVDYELTDLGRSLIGPISILFDWAKANQADMLAVRARFSRSTGK